MPSILTAKCLQIEMHMQVVVGYAMMLCFERMGCNLWEAPADREKTLKAVYK